MQFYKCLDFFGAGENQDLSPIQKAAFSSETSFVVGPIASFSFLCRGDRLSGAPVAKGPSILIPFLPPLFPPERNVVSVLECREGRISLISYKQRSSCLLWMVKGKLGEILQLHNRHIVLYGFRFQFSG